MVAERCEVREMVVAVKLVSKDAVEYEGVPNAEHNQGKSSMRMRRESVSYLAV
jgi:hypothetical protein